MAFKISGSTTSEVDAFFDEYKKAQEYVSSFFEGSMQDNPLLRAVSEGGVSLRPMIDRLPYEERRAVLNKFRQIYGFDDALGTEEEVLSFVRTIQSGGKASLDSLMEVGEDTGSRRVFKFDIAEGAIEPSKKRNPLVSILNNLSIQYDENEALRLLDQIDRGEQVDIRGAFKFGGNILQADYVRGLDETLTRAMAMPSGQNILVFDTETLGLGVGKGNVRQVSAMQMMSDGKGGFDEAVDPFNKFFRTATAQVGMISEVDQAGLRTPRTLVDYLDGLADPNNLISDTGGGDEFVEALKPLLRQMRDSEYIMGHNVQFDLDQIITSVKLTGQYISGKDTELVGLVDEITEKVQGGRGVLDTLHIAKAKLPKLNSAAELGFSGAKTTHSLENLMLQTDLIDRLVEESGGGAVGRSAVMDFLGMTQSGAMHQADVDTKLTAKLFQFLTDSQGLQASPLGGRSGMSTPEADFYGQVRTFVRRSYAPTPISNIADIRDIDPRLFSAILTEGDERIRFGVLDQGKTLMEQLSLTRVKDDSYTLSQAGNVRFSGTSQELFDLMSKDSEPFYASAKITPLEQEVFLTRNLVQPLEDYRVTEDTFFSLGNVRRVTGKDTPYAGLINKVGTFFKRGVSLKPGEFSEMQRTMQSMNLPFAGLSLPETMLTNAMARSTAGLSGVEAIMGSTYKDVVDIADDIGISHFKTWDTAMQTGSGKVQLPAEILRAAGVMDESGDLLSLSTYNYTRGISGDTLKGVNLSLDLSEAQIQTLQKFLETADEAAQLDELGGKSLFDYGITSNVKKEILSGLNTHGNYGVAVGSIEGKAGEEIASVLENNILLEQVGRDTDKIPIRVRLLDITRGTSGGEDMGLGRIGPAFLDRFMDKEGEDAITEGMERGRKILDDMVDFADSEGGSRIFAAARSSIEMGNPQLGQKIYQGYKVARKGAPFAAGAAIIGAGALFMSKRKKESDMYNETMEQQPTEDYSDYSAYREDMGMQQAPARRLPDPLLTSYLVGDMDQNKIGHTKMGSQKYSNLFNGY